MVAFGSHRVQIGLSDGTSLTLTRDQAADLTMRLRHVEALDGAVALAAQLQTRLDRAPGLGSPPLQLLAREQHALETLLHDLRRDD